MEVRNSNSCYDVLDRIQLSFTSRDNRMVASTIVTGILLVMASVLLLAGYRLLRASTYLSGVIAGFLVAYIIFLEFSHLAYPLMLCISGSIAVSFGFVTMLLEPVAVIILSLQSGVCIGSLSGVILYGLLHTISGWIFYIMVVIPAISITLLSLPDRLQKQLIIFNTSMTSASLIATFIDNFLFNGATLTYLYTLFKSINMSAPCTSSWVFAGVCVTSTTLGVLIQSLFTARGVVHHKGFRCIQTPEPKRRLSSSSMVSRSTISIDSLELQPSEEKFRTMYSKRLTVGEVPTQACMREVETATTATTQKSCPSQPVLQEK